MKTKVIASFAATLTIWLLCTNSLATAVTSIARAFTIGDAARFFGYFLLVMGAIFLALIFTGWLGKRQGKHKK